MTKFILAACTIFLIATPATAEERIDHYEGQKITSTEQAIDILNHDSKKISAMLTGKTIESQTFESIHQISYTLENATDALIKKKASNQKALDTLDEAVQALHHASENHEEDKVKEWAPKLAAAIANLQKPATNTDEATPAKDTTFVLTLKDHKFDKEEIHAPAGEKIKLIIKNMDPTPEEFESNDFRREKIIAGNSEATIHVGPLKPGKYHYFGEFNLKTANGYLIVE